MLDELKAKLPSNVLKLIDAASLKRIHLAIMREPYLTLLLEGTKTIESRFTKNRIVPYGQIEDGDIVFIAKNGFIHGMFIAGKTISIQLEGNDIDDVRKKYNSEICADEDFWESKQDAHYATLTKVTNVKKLDPIRIAKRDQRSWVILKSKAPTPRPGVYELYWKFAYERQKAFESRLAGEPAPWSDDPIIQKYKFCNVFRASDRVSQYMIKEVCYNLEPNHADDRIFQIVAFRFFSNIQTWESIKNILGRAPIISDLVDGSFEDALNKTKEQYNKLYTGAFILCATDAYGRHLKHLNHVELFKDMFINQNIGERIRRAANLTVVYLFLHQFPLIGDFMAYQIAIDLNYSEYINFSENDFTKAGPGALRGIKKVFEDTNGMTPEEVIMWMVGHQDDEFKKLGYDFEGLNGRKLHAIDAQGLFCETDKYCREAAPELKSARSRIKAKFTQSEEPIEFFYPPKWGLN